MAYSSSTAACLQCQRVSGGNPIPACSQHTVTDAICWEIISFPIGEARQVELENFGHSHCLIHDGDNSACRYEVEQLAVWFNINNPGPHAAKLLRWGWNGYRQCFFSTNQHQWFYSKSCQFELSKIWKGWATWAPSRVKFRDCLRRTQGLQRENAQPDCYKQHHNIQSTKETIGSNLPFLQYL